MSKNELAQLMGVKTEARDVTHALTRLSEAGMTVAAPGGTTMCMEVPRGLKVSVSAIRIGQDEVYRDRSSGQTCFKATALSKLSKGIGFRWKPEMTRRLDNGEHPFRCHMLVVGEYLDYTGEWVPCQGTKQLDLRDEAEHGYKDKQLRRARTNIAQLCETMAKSRAIADACISRTVDPNLLDQPIVMAKVYRDRSVSADEVESATAAMYGPRDDDAPSGGGKVIDAEVIPNDAPAGAADFVVPKGLPHAGKALGVMSTEEIEALMDVVDEKLKEVEKAAEGGAEGAAEWVAKTRLEVRAPIHSEIAARYAEESDDAPTGEQGSFGFGGGE